MKKEMFLAIYFILSSSVIYAQDLDTTINYICNNYKALAEVDIAAKNQISKQLGKPYKTWKKFKNDDFPEYLRPKGPLLAKYRRTSYAYLSSTNMGYLGCKFDTTFRTNTYCNLKVNISEEDEEYIEKSLNSCLPGPRLDFEWREFFHGFENTHSSPIAYYRILVSHKHNFISIDVDGSPDFYDQHQRYINTIK